MLTHDHRAGSFALCVNKETGHTLNEILENTGLETNLNFPIYWGGPVSQQTIWMLHSNEWSIGETVELKNGWSMTSNAGMFKRMVDGDIPKHFRIMFGYCSWAENQLRCEIEGLGPWKKENSWLVAKNLGPEWLFESPVDTLWESATTLSSHQAVDSWL
jgi:putative transcriptional regulator